MNLNNITIALKTGITIYQYEQWKNTGSVNLFQKESHMLSKVWLKTNLNEDSNDKPFIQLYSTFTEESEIREFNEWVEKNQYKIYPLLADILKISLKDAWNNYSNISNTHYEGGNFTSMLTVQIFNLDF